MSVIRYEGTRLIQSFVQEKEELGYIERDKESGKYTLWLKDLYGLVIGEGSYVKGGTLRANSLKDAQYEALTSDSAHIMHLIWMRNRAVHTVESNWKEIDRKTGGNVTKESVIKSVLQNVEKAAIQSSIRECIEWVVSLFG